MRRWEVEAGLRHATVFLREKGLKLASRWAGEQLLALDGEREAGEEDGGGGGGGASTAYLEAVASASLTELPPGSRAEAIFLSARALFDNGEYQRCAAVLRTHGVVKDVHSAPSAAVFLFAYALFLAGEQRKREKSMETEANAAAIAAAGGGGAGAAGAGAGGGAGNVAAAAAAVAAAAAAGAAAMEPAVVENPFLSELNELFCSRCRARRGVLDPFEKFLFAAVLREMRPFTPSNQPIVMLQRRMPHRRRPSGQGEKAGVGPGSVAKENREAGQDGVEAERDIEQEDLDVTVDAIGATAETLRQPDGTAGEVDDNNSDNEEDGGSDHITVSARQLLIDSVAAYPWNWSAWLDLHLICDTATTGSVFLHQAPADDLSHPSAQDCLLSDGAAIPAWTVPVTLEEIVAAAERQCVVWPESAAQRHEDQAHAPELCPEHLAGIECMYQCFLVHALIEHQQPDDALVALERIEPIFPTVQSAFTAIHRAVAEYLRRDYESAEEIFEHLRQREPHRLDRLDVYSNILYVREKAAELSALAHAAVSVDKYCPETCCIVGNYYSLRGKHEHAALYFQRALRLDRRFLSAWTLLGHEFVELCNTSAAIEAYRRALEVSRRDFRAWYGLGQTYEILHLNHYAVYYYRKAAALRPNDARMWCAVGNCFRLLGRYDDAVRAYIRAIDNNDVEGVATQHIQHIIDFATAPVRAQYQQRLSTQQQRQQLHQLPSHEQPQPQHIGSVQHSGGDGLEESSTFLSDASAPSSRLRPLKDEQEQASLNLTAEFDFSTSFGVGRSSHGSRSSGVSAAHAIGSLAPDMTDRSLFSADDTIDSQMSRSVETERSQRQTRSSTRRRQR